MHIHANKILYSNSQEIQENKILVNGRTNDAKTDEK
jgi:hypothetical protein